MNILNRGFLLGLLFVTALAWTVQTFAAQCPKPIHVVHHVAKKHVLPVPESCPVCPVCAEIPVDYIPVQPLIYYTIVTTPVTVTAVQPSGFYISDWVVGVWDSWGGSVTTVGVVHGNQAPEIDPSGTVPALTLCIGGLVVICSGRK